MKDEHITGIADRDPGLVYGPAKPITFYAGLKASI
jgi:hypothetical protein